MLNPRAVHAAVYHTPHLYILGGWGKIVEVTDCERYVCAENRWEALPPLPRACRAASGVVLESSLYALGGIGLGELDLVQKLSLESLTWELMQFRLPYVGFAIPCFKMRDTEVYLVVNQTLCSLSALEVRPLKILIDEDIFFRPILTEEDVLDQIQSWCGTSYYCRGTLYCSNFRGGVLSSEIGSLSN
jgi:hypothetical protein